MTNYRNNQLAYWAYLFEARSIHEYSLDGRNLAEQIAASNLVESLCGAPLSAVLETLGVGSELGFSRRTAGAFQAVLEGADAGEKARRLRDLWGIAVSYYCPGLEFVHALAEGETPRAAVRDGIRKLAEAGQRPGAAFPEAPPLARRDLYSGRAAVSAGIGSGGEREWRDAASLRKHYAGTVPDWAESMLDDPALERRTWPRRFLGGDDSEPCFPWLPGNGYLAAVRIAANDPSEWIRCLEEAADLRPAEFTRLFWTFSDGLESAIRRAARQASAAVLAPARLPGAEGSAALPARPVLLRDGEFTVMVRADLALAFAAACLAEFERASEAALAPLRSELPRAAAPLGGCAGIAFFKASHPLVTADRLATALCERAKAESGRVGGRRPSCLSLGLAVGNPVGLGGEACLPAVDSSAHPGFPAYGIAEGSLPGWRLLEELAALLSEDSLAIGPTRQLISLLGLDPAEASQQYRRWREVVGKALPQSLERLDALLASFGVPAREPPVVRRGEAWASPVADALILRAVGHAFPHPKLAAERAHA
jgi:hypothetical protein